MESALQKSENLRLQLHKSLSAIKSFLKFFKEMRDRCKPHVDSLLNLVEQYQCCEKVDASLLPKRVDFVDVQNRLIYKIAVEINKELDDLNTQLILMGSQVSALGKYSDYCIVHYQRDYEMEDIYRLSQRSVTTPAVTEMLEWIEESSRLARERYLCKQHLLETFPPQQSDVTDQFLNHWNDGDSHMVNKMEEYMALTAGFLEETGT